MRDHSRWNFICHDYKVISVRNYFQPWMDPLTREIRTDVGENKTDVLYRCACGKVKTKKLTGHWKLEEVTP